ncbi:NfeD family protein [Corynebacterium sp. CCM 8835]|uniref:NfeD family protein n=1 Tax=Corynebacterium antarcticum TaxID=2800405 RepID=A0ABS1FKG5_9CORY|nr:NfeD family protein [Corynebacterium antarcticum]MCK7641429.1 NfeD family protein [Corynebacterium antarcticum]MCK7660469.1 NfeD family protein [Corynebacterium antarcticum]MCL0244660.1 NfeD family protein [Corynebacterium antarcticum]MCX7491030.1 NfeD family protein [Corynebacterium antarcticum]MCX7539783.1 NfeD family protein [Corynebacterium antarcticum]
MGALIWLIAAVLLAALELMAGDFTLLLLGGAALAAAGVAVLEVPLWVEIAAFAVSSLALLIFARPALRRRTLSTRMLDISPQALVGTSATVLEDVDGHSGQIRLDGDVWSARSLDPTHRFAPGDRVNVVKIDGAIAVVWKEI